MVTIASTGRTDHQAELADYNVLVELMNMDSERALVDSELDQLRHANGNEALLVEKLFLNRKEKENEVQEIENQIEQVSFNSESPWRNNEQGGAAGAGTFLPEAGAGDGAAMTFHPEPEPEPEPILFIRSRSRSRSCLKFPRLRIPPSALKVMVPPLTVFVVSVLKCQGDGAAPPHPRVMLAPLEVLEALLNVMFLPPKPSVVPLRVMVRPSKCPWRPSMGCCRR